ncbi:glycosyltransferase family 2 protein [Butyrivibrio sp. AE2032]|uniref:glycosyltransferase family 2 protein n=1 Tax=Butyrivibrio sp. AE2032 TaxID=1458463 RepID=UPI0005525CB1|nr:glycosyltransferase family 2 protein [Butyrivibrio sp. AE2032]
MDSNGEKLVSIIVPVYQAKDTLRRCVLSCLNQKFIKDHELEVILVDDGSTDGSGGICDELQKEFGRGAADSARQTRGGLSEAHSGDQAGGNLSGTQGRIKVVHTKNFGVSHARNLGLERATGRFVAFVDADDQVKEEFLEGLMKYADEGTVLLDDTDSYSGSQKISGFQYIENCILNSNSHVWGKLFDRKTISENHIMFQEGLTIGEDLLFLLDFALSQEKRHTIRCVATGDYIYTENESGAMKSAFKASYMDEIRCWKQAEDKLLPYRENLSSFAFVSLAASQIMTAFLVIGKVAVMETSAGSALDKELHGTVKGMAETKDLLGKTAMTGAADSDLAKLAVDEASKQINHALKTHGAFAALSAGYKIKVMVFRLSPSLYLKLYGKHKGN